MTTQIQDWTEIQGVLLGGRYPLVECMEANRKAARFRTIVANKPCSVGIRIAGEDESGNGLARWQFLKRSPHPNLLTIIDAGRCELQGLWLEYVVMEHYQENVAGVITERALTGTEAREMLESIVPALAHLHAHGIVHGSLRPATIVAADDKIKLEVIESRAAGTNGYTAATDLSALGATLLECLNGQHSGPPIRLMEPFATIVARCSADVSQDRPTAQEVLALLRGDVPVLPPRMEPQAGPAQIKVARRPIILAAAVLVACGAVLVGLVHHPSEPHASEPHASEPVPIAPSLPKAPKSVEQPKAWRVIIYTFNRRMEARKKAGRINAKWPDLHAEVFSPDQGKGPYLVSVGGRMTRDEASRFRQRVVALGLPKNAYSRNFTN